MKHWKKWKFKIFWEIEKNKKSQNFNFSNFLKKSHFFWTFSKISKFQNLKFFEKISKFQNLWNCSKKSQNRNVNFFFFFYQLFFLFFCFQFSKIFLGQISRTIYFGHSLISKMSIFRFWHPWNDRFFSTTFEIRKQTNRDWVQNDRKSFSFRAVNFLRMLIIVWRP